jgi:hypothetical protein
MKPKTTYMIFLQSTAITLLAAMLTACAGGGQKEEEKKENDAEQKTTENNDKASKLEGAWEIKRAEGNMSEMNTGTVYEFKGNKLTFSKDGFNNPGKTEVTDSTFTFQADGNEYKFTYNYHMNGDTLVVTMEKGTGQVFHMIKK